MEADFSVELGCDDPALEIPWAAENGPRYLDLKRSPDLLVDVEEAQRVPELREFLLFLNSPSSLLESAKCDVWSSDQIHPDEEIFGAAWKFGCYVDLLFSHQQARFSFDDHERFARRVVELLKHVPEIPASAEFIIRRCYYHEGADSRDGFYITMYVLGFGDGEEQARQQWAIGLKLVENAIRQPRPFHPVT